MSDDRVDPYLEGLEHDKTYENIYFTDMPTMIGLLEEFIRRHMLRWHKEHEEITPNGRRYSSTYTISEQKTWDLRAASPAARIGSALRAGEGGPIRAIASVPYELRCDFTLEAEPPHRLRLAMHVTERIDPSGSVTQYPLGRAYVAPSLLHVEGYFGAELDPFLTSRLIPRG